MAWEEIGKAILDIFKALAPIFAPFVAVFGMTEAFNQQLQHNPLLGMIMGMMCMMMFMTFIRSIMDMFRGR